MYKNNNVAPSTFSCHNHMNRLLQKHEMIDIFAEYNLYNTYSWFHIKGTYCVHAFNGDYLSLWAQVAEKTFSWNSQYINDFYVFTKQAFMTYNFKRTHFFYFLYNDMRNTLPQAGSWRSCWVYTGLRGTTCLRGKVLSISLYKTSTLFNL